MVLATSLLGDLVIQRQRCVRTVRQRLMMSTAVTFAALAGRRSPQLAQSRRHGLPGDGDQR